jgi:hypothetical protein
MGNKKYSRGGAPKIDYNSPQQRFHNNLVRRTIPKVNITQEAYIPRVKLREEEALPFNRPQTDCGLSGVSGLYLMILRAIRRTK